jgi:hypothetical protein
MVFGNLKKIVMPKIERLSKKVAVPEEIWHTITYLRTHEGLCICGRFLNATDAKQCLGYADTIRGFVIAAYCFDCFLRINTVIKSLVNRFAHPEPDQRRHESGA